MSERTTGRRPLDAVTEICENGETVIDAATLGHMRYLARRWGHAPWIVGMEPEDNLQEGILVHLQRRQDPAYKPPIEVHQAHYRRCRDMTLRGGHRSLGVMGRGQEGRLRAQRIVQDPTGESDVDRAAKISLARVLLAHLDEGERRIVELRFEGNDPRAIAREIGQSSREVAQTLDRALGKLREAAVTILWIDARIG